MLASASQPPPLPVAMPAMPAMPYRGQIMSLAKLSPAGPAGSARGSYHWWPGRGGPGVVVGLARAWRWGSEATGGGIRLNCMHAVMEPGQSKFFPLARPGLLCRFYIPPLCSFCPVPPLWRRPGRPPARLLLPCQVCRVVDGPTRPAERGAAEWRRRPGAGPSAPRRSGQAPARLRPRPPPSPRKSRGSFDPPLSSPT